MSEADPTPDAAPVDPTLDVGGAGSGDHPGPAPVDGDAGPADPGDDVLGGDGGDGDDGGDELIPPAEPDEHPVAAGPPDDVAIDLDAAAGAEVADGDGVEQLQAALAAAEAQRDEYLEHLQRARADYDNLSKRKNRELGEALDRGAAAVLQQLLGVLDTFSYAIDAARSTEDQSLAKGVQMVHDQLIGVLRGAGLEEIPGAGEAFDPNLHEALMQVEADDDLEHPVVAEVLRTGYRFKGRVLRPASVKVAQ